MTKGTTKTTKPRRPISKARLYKAIVAETSAKGLTNVSDIGELLELLKDDIVAEAT